LLATHKHTAGNSVHCVEKSIGQATAAVDAIFLLILSQCTSSKAQRHESKRIDGKEMKLSPLLVYDIGKIVKTLF
jgi:hypothetical protein